MAGRIIAIAILLLVSCNCYARPLVTDKAGWDWFTLRKYLMYAYSSLCTQNLQDWTCYWCTKTPGVPPINVTLIFSNDGTSGTYGYVGYSKESIVISFRGSVSAQNWMSDFEFVRLPYPDVKGAAVHHGFWEDYMHVNKSVVTAVLALHDEHPDLPVIVTGHSLGASLSELCALELVRQGISNIQVWNFGCPRVGNPEFASYYHSAVPITYRMINQRDLVPHYPAQTMGYYHVATEVWFPHNTTTYVICDSSGEDKHCSDSLLVLDPADHTTYLGFDQHAGFPYHCGNI